MTRLRQLVAADGKRIRPALALVGRHAAGAGGELRAAHHLAASPELLHTGRPRRPPPALTTPDDSPRTEPRGIPVTGPAAALHPAIDPPVPDLLHPGAEGVDEDLLSWVGTTGLVTDPGHLRRFHAARFGTFSARTCPRTPLLQLAARWNGHMWITDDWIDDPARDPAEITRLGADLLAVLTADPLTHRPACASSAGAASAGPAAHDSLTAALGELWGRTAGPMSADWRRRFAGHYRDVFAMTALARRDAGKGLGLPTYLRRRRNYSGCEVSFDLSEAVNGCELPLAVATAEPYRDVRALACHVVAATNDVFSVPRQQDGDGGDHLVAVLAGAAPGDAPAIDRALALIRALTDDFLTAADDLRTMRPLFLGSGAADREGWERVERTLDDLALWIAGNLRWHRESHRYLPGHD
ncbi:hypothetical protein [Kitasatospora sp. NBC_01539]|uniref:terpene synthase family protein n=1 Tax=Kitasatospora sp. NBC_01539 TaxID=2903577 RepID=UPI00386025AB